MRARLARMSLLVLVVCLGVAARAQEAGSKPTDLEDLRNQVASLMRDQRYSDAQVVLEKRSQATNADDEERQYALLTLGELFLFYVHKPEESIQPFESLVADYHPDSPYVASARYDLGSLYMDKGDAVRSFTNLARVPRSSPHYGDAQTKLDWATRNLRNVVKLPFGWELPVGRLGLIAIFADVFFTLVWVSQSLFSKGKHKLIVWASLVALIVVKIVISYQFVRIGG